MKIGVLGGTFDPPHWGHLKLAESAIDALELDEVILLPANKNPFKERQRSVEPKHRIAMAQLLTKHHPKLAVSDMEVTRGGLSYTVDTLGELQMVHPGEYWFIMGADSLKSFENWKNPQRIMRMCRLAVAARKPFHLDELKLMLPEEFQEKLDVIEMPETPVSSTDLREKLIRNLRIDSFTAPEIVDYIKKNKLYTHA